jgi:hypothetical protein
MDVCLCFSALCCPVSPKESYKMSKESISKKKVRRLKKKGIRKKEKEEES